MVALLLAALLTHSAEQEVTFKGAGGLDLKGTFTMPDNPKGPVPAILLLPGSGPSDRNANQLPNLVTDLLRQISDRLVAEGFATLRYDKRAIRIYADQWPKEVPALQDFFSWGNFVDDAKAGLAALDKMPGVDPKRVFLAGHSEGGMITAQVAHDLAGKPEAPWGLILMGTPGRTMDPILKEQVANSLRRAGLPKATLDMYSDYMEKAIAQLRRDGTVPPDPPPGLGALFPPSALKLVRSYLDVDPPKLLANYEGPILVLQGEKDIQVSAERDAKPLEAALRARKKGTTEVLIVPSASHNLKSVKDPEKEPAFAGPIVPEALDRIARWIKQQTNGSSRSSPR